ncbi:MAG: anti-sigma factor domain-containing protein [Aeromicrobium sp.]
MNDIHALTGAYVLDSLTDFERAEFERHLEACPDCQAEVASLSAAAVGLSELSASSPPPALREQILAGTRTVRPLPPRMGAEHRAVRRWPRLVAAAAVLIGLGAGVSTVWHPWKPDVIQVSLVDRVRQAPDAQVWTQRLESGGRATVIRSASVGAAVWRTEGLSAAPEGRVYELWLQAPDESLKPAGLLSSGDGAVVLRGDAIAAIGAGLTVEPAGGSPAPTSDPIAFIDLRAGSTPR